MKELKYLRICIEKAKIMELTPFMIERLEDVFTRLQELEALQQVKSCDGCIRLPFVLTELAKKNGGKCGTCKRFVKDNFQPKEQ